MDMSGMDAEIASVIEKLSSMDDSQPRKAELRVRESRPLGKPAAGEKAAKSGPSTINIRRMGGFGPMSRLTTSFGDVHAYVIRKGDMIRDGMGQFNKVQSVHRIKLDDDFLARHPDAQPIRVRKNALGPGLPKADVILAPFQMVRPGPARSNLPMVPAIELLDRPFVERATELQMTYTEIGVGKSIVGNCEGLAVEIAS